MPAGLRLILGGLFTAAISLAAQSTDSPEAVLRALMLAMYGGDVPAFERLTVPHPMRTRLTAAARANEAALRALTDDPGALQLRERREKWFKGEAATPAADGKFPAGTTALYTVAHRGGSMALPLVRQPDGWKVDLRWWLGMMEMASGRPSATGTPDATIRSLLAATLRFDRARAAGLLSDPKTVEVLFLGAPSQRDPSGVLDAVVFEMPLVEIGPDERYPMLVGPIVEGSNDPNRKVLVGLFGPIEIPFVLVKKGGDWKVLAQPYYAWMNR